MNCSNTHYLLMTLFLQKACGLPDAGFSAMGRNVPDESSPELKELLRVFCTTGFSTNRRQFCGFPCTNMALAAQRGAGCARRPAVWPPHPPTRRGPGPDPALSKLSWQAAEFGAEACCRGSLSLGKVGRKGSSERGLERAVELRSSQVDCTWRVPGTLVGRACQNWTYRVANNIFTATEDSKYVDGSVFHSHGARGLRSIEGTAVFLH